MAGRSRGSAGRRVCGSHACAHCRAACRGAGQRRRRRPALQCARMTHRRTPRRRTRRSRHSCRCAACSYHLHTWGDASLATPERPPLVMLHGWMDVGASFQFVVDALAAADGFERWVIAPDWRGFGLHRPRRAPTPTGSPTTWATSTRCSTPCSAPGAADRPARPQHGRQRGDELRRRAARSASAGWSTWKASACPRRSRTQAPQRLAQWLDELKTPQTLRSYDSLRGRGRAAAARTTRCCTPDKARLAGAALVAPRSADGRWHILGDPAHKRVNPVLYREDEVLETWKLHHRAGAVGRGRPHRHHQVVGPPLPAQRFRGAAGGRCRSVQRERLSPCGHMLHHDQPEALARALAALPGLSAAARGSGCMRESPAVTQASTAHHGHRTHQPDRHAARRPERPHRAAPGVSLTTTAKPCG